MSNQLYYGDNLQVLRDSIANESVDLIYLDPPFNSNATYNILFKTPRAFNLMRRLRHSRIHGTGGTTPKQYLACYCTRPTLTLQR